MTTLNELVISWLNSGETSVTSKLNEFWGHFEAEYGWHIKRFGTRKALQEYISGLPSHISTPFENWEILEIAEKHDLFPSLSEDDILLNWFENVARALLCMHSFFNKRPTIADIANNCGGYYFTRSTLKFWRQRRSDFRIYKTENPDVFKTHAIYRVPDTNSTGESIAYWKKTVNCTFVQVKE